MNPVSVWPPKSYAGATQSKSNPTKKIILLRILVVLSLVSTAVIVGYGSYYFINRSQFNLETENYSSITNSLEVSIVTGIEREIDALDILTNTYSYLFPNSSQWPYIDLSMNYYGLLSASLISTANMRTIAFAPIVTPEQVPRFEEFAYSFLNESGHSDLGISPFGKGIYSKYPNGSRYHDVHGTLAHNRSFLAPVLDIGDLVNNGPVIMYNSRSEQKRINALDFSMDCVVAGGSPRNCTAITGIVQLVQDIEFRPANVITQPITVPDSKIPVGFISLTHNWDVILSNSVAGYVSGIHAVLCTQKMECYTFEYVNGKAIYRGIGDTHDTKYNNRMHAFRATPFASTEVFMIYIYPSDHWMSLFIDRTLSIAVCAVTVFIIFLTSAIFFLYDFLINREATEKELISSTKRQFVKFMSHEIRTPLNIVHLGLKVMYSEMFQFIVKEKAKNGDTASVTQLNDWLTLISDMEVSSDSAIVVLNDLINYDKIDAASLNIEKEQVNMWDVILTNVNPFAVQARHNGIHFEKDINIHRENVSLHDRSEMKQLLVIGDSVKLGQVIRNLVSNALKFTPSGGNVTVIADYCPLGMLDVDPVKAKNNAIEYEKAGSIKISVKDTGAGLSQDNQMKLFSEGMQFNVNQLQAGQGSGLGLWITKGVVQLHHGTITAISEGENLGCVFIVELPLVKLKGMEVSVDEDIGSKSIQTVLSKSQLISTVSNSSQIQNVLVVDDSALNRKMICRLLRSVGYICTEAADGQECVNHMVRCESGQQDHIDLILMDYEMPRMNGPVATSVLREMGCQVPVIGITGNVLSEDKNYFIEHGAVTVLTKPLKLSQFETAINELNSQLVKKHLEVADDAAV